MRYVAYQRFKGHVIRVVYFLSALLPPDPPRPDDSAVWVDQQEWGAAGQKSVPPGHGAGGLGHPGALPGRTGCAVSSPLHPNSFQICCCECNWNQSRTCPQSRVKSAAIFCWFVFCFAFALTHSSLVFLFTQTFIMILASAPFLNGQRFCYCCLCHILLFVMNRVRGVVPFAKDS